MGDWEWGVPEVVPGQSAREVLSVERMNAMRQAMLDLERRVGAVEGRGGARGNRGGRRPRFQVWLEPTLMRLYVSEGLVTGGSAGRVKPMMPKIGTVELTADPAPYIDCTGRDVDTNWQLVVAIYAEEAKVELVDRDEEAPAETAGAELVWVLADLKLKAAGAGMALEEFTPLWNSDIPGVSSGPCPLGAVTATVDTGAWTLVAGYVSGGTASFLVEPGAITPVVGEHLWLECDWTGDEEDGVVLPGGELTAVTLEQGAAIPADVLPTPGSLLGTAHLPVGFWADDGAANPVWNPAGCGAFVVKFCLEGFLYYRT